MIKEMVKGEKEKMLERNLYIHNINQLKCLSISYGHFGVKQEPLLIHVLRLLFLINQPCCPTWQIHIHYVVQDDKVRLFRLSAKNSQGRSLRSQLHVGNNVG
jgi:hypothetical protein